MLVRAFLQRDLYIDREQAPIGEGIDVFMLAQLDRRRIERGHGMWVQWGAWALVRPYPCQPWAAGVRIELDHGNHGDDEIGTIRAQVKYVPEGLMFCVHPMDVRTDGGTDGVVLCDTHRPATVSL